MEKILTKCLPRGYAKIAAKKLKVSEGIVYNVAYGRSRNNRIEMFLLKMVCRAKNRQHKLDVIRETARK